MSTPSVPISTPAPTEDSNPGFFASLGKSLNNLTGATTAIPNAVGSVIANAPNAVQTQQNDSAQVKQAPSITGPEATGLALGIGGNQGTLSQAQQSAQNIGQTEKSIASPQAQNVINTATGQTVAGSQQYQTAVQQYQATQSDIQQKALNAENALTFANQKANINPQQYLDTMGVDQKTITALGMVLSGIGSGLTGQPNLAMQAFQQNVDRNIAAQKQVFLQRMQSAAQSQGLLQTAQDKARLDLAAQQYATITVNNGISNLVNGTQMKVTAATAPDMANIINNKAQQDALGSLGQFNQNYINTYNSGDTKNLNLLGIGLDAATQHLTGVPLGNNVRRAAAGRATNAAGVPGSQYSLFPSNTQQPQMPVSTNPAMSTTQNQTPVQLQYPSKEDATNAFTSPQDADNFLSAVANKVKERSQSK